MRHQQALQHNSSSLLREEDLTQLRFQEARSENDGRNAVLKREAREELTVCLVASSRVNNELENQLAFERRKLDELKAHNQLALRRSSDVLAAQASEANAAVLDVK